MHDLSDRYRPEIDGLRALAVVSVIINHLSQGYLPGGFLGVDIFFVISGYVITGSLLDGTYPKFSDYISAFYVRRILRLLPTLLIVILIGSIAICLVATWQYAGLGIRTALAAAFGVSNIYLYRQAIDYWGGQAALNPFTHTWSLGVEEQFYLFYPLLIWLLYRSPKSNKTSALSFSIITLCSLTLISLLSYAILFKDASLIFYGSPFRFWEIFSGGLLFVYVNHAKKLYKVSGVDTERRPSIDSFGKKKSYLAFLSLLLIFIPLCISDKYISVPIKTFLVVGATVIFIATAQFNPRIFYIFTTRPVIYTGKISYSLYLWHWPVLVLGKWMGFESNSSILIKGFIIVLLSILTHRYVECYFRQRKWPATNSKIIVISILVTVAVCSIVTLSGVVARKMYKQKMPFEAVMIHNDYSCHSPKWTTDPIRDCLAPKNLMLKHIYVMGDSHSTNLIPSIERSMGKQYELRYLGDSEFTSSLFGDGPSKNLMDCIKYDCSRNEFQKRLDFLNKTLQAGDYLIFTLSRDSFYVLQDFENGIPRTALNPGINDFIEKMIVIGQLINERGGKLFLVNGIPKVCSHKKFELGKVTSPGNPCQGSRDESLQDRQPLTDAFNRISERTGAVVIDPHPYLCPEAECTSTFQGRLIYFDGSPHFITAFPDPLTQFFLDNLFR